MVNIYKTQQKENTYKIAQSGHFVNKILHSKKK